MISVAEFMRQFENEDACRTYLFQLRWSEGFRCPACDSDRYCELKGRRFYQCLDCRLQVSVTSGTVMHRTKLPLSYWLFTFCWIASGEPFSAQKLAATLQINYRSASRLLRLARIVMRQYNGIHPLSRMNEKGTEPLVEQAKTIMLGNAMQFIRSVYRRVAPRYLQSYVDEYYFRRNRSSCFRQLLMKLLKDGFRVTMPIYAYTCPGITPV